MSRIVALLAIALALTAPLAVATPAAVVNPAGTLVAQSFVGCIPGSNCDVIKIYLPNANHPHALTHSVSASHSSGFPPSFELVLYAIDASTGASIPFACPNFWTAGAPAGAQSCTLPAYAGDVVVYGEFIALRPHLTGTVTFTNHALTAI